MLYALYNIDTGCLRTHKVYQSYLEAAGEIDDRENDTVVVEFRQATAKNPRPLDDMD